MRRSDCAFTLVELLVVVAIIVVLLAMLVPAMDKAIYQAELAVCATHQKATASGVTMYAADFKRRYPHRGGVTAGAWQNAKFFDDANRDQKPIMPYVGINGAFNDPLAGTVNYETSIAGTHGYSPYALWYGWQFKPENQPVQRGMFKMGDRWTWPNSTVSPTRIEEYNVLVSDLDFVGDNSQVFGAHPDRDGVMQNVVLQDEIWNNEVQIAPGVSAGVNQFTLAWWSRKDGIHARGELDLNFAYDDSSVERFVDVAWTDMIPTSSPPTRLHSVTWNVVDGWWPGLRVTVPVLK